MDTFLVGGAVRDRLLGLAVQDRDWVVVGAAPDDMLAAGFLPVGRDFPVFLHPVTREEHALARTERKTGAGYRGFAFDASPAVTLEQDLSRRDLTINAIAERADGSLVDPYGGQRDLHDRVLRHVSPAFAEDPVRILRLARFAARFGDFRIAEETQALLRRMVDAGEADALVPERVWRELARGLMEPRPARMLAVLHACGALARLLPEIAPGARLDATLDAAVGLGAPLAVRFACLFHGDGVAEHAAGSDRAADAADDAGDAARTAGMPVPADAAAARVAALCERLRVPTDCRDLAAVVAREHRAVEASATADAETLVRWLERTDTLRRPQRLDDILLAAAAIAFGAGRSPDAALGEGAPLRQALDAARRVETATVARDAAARGLRGPAVGEAVHASRVEAVGSRVETDGDHAGQVQIQLRPDENLGSAK